MENLMSTGEFATASRLSRKALRLYAANGLLPPRHVDPRSGYRGYAPEQLRTAALIAALRGGGMGLDEIRAFLLAPSVARLEAFRRRAEAEFAGRRQVLRRLSALLEEELVFDVTSRPEPPLRYAGRTRRVFVAGLEPFVRTVFAELGAGDGPPFVIYHGPVNADEDGPVEACVPRADGPGELPGGEVAVTRITGEQCAFPRILGAYEALYSWAGEHGREPAGPPREVYLGADPEELEIVLPLR